VSPAASLTWVGHATAVIDVDGFRVLTDPLLCRRVAHLRRRVGHSEPRDAEIDIVVISHAHMDHLHPRSLRKVAADVPTVAPRGTAALLRRSGRREIIEVGAGEEVHIGRARLVATPAVHPAGRGPFSRVAAEPVGFLVDIGGHRTYFAGDTGLFDGMGSLGPVDLALLPIWGWGPSLGAGHLDPQRAVRAAELVGARLVVPIHWGTFAPEDLRRGPPRWLARPAADFERALERSPHRIESRVIAPGTTIPV
jgi:L-ascorbate metabolism protein UlaG (beta-lactamase superfamily)